MYIRKLCLTDEADFRQELKAIGMELPPESLKSYLPSQFIFKFLDIPESVFLPLTSYLQEKNISFWENSSSSPKSLMVVASSWNLLSPDLSDEKLAPVLKSWKVLRENNQRETWEYKISGGSLKIDHPLIMGVLNVTPDSFSDGGQFLQADEAQRQAELMVAGGADIIDIGAESTRPGAREVSVNEEWQRLEPVLMALKNRVNIPVSIDTYKSEIARRALDSGADLINDISGLTFDKKMAEVAGRADCPVVIMHIKGTPRNMQVDPYYDNLLEELFIFFQDRISYCKNQGISQIIIDPGIGFGKRLEDNYEIIRRLAEFKSFGYPVLVGPSRKSFLGKVLQKEVQERLFGTAAAIGASLQNGANIVRVHDVSEMSEIARITRAIKSKNFLQQID